MNTLTEREYTPSPKRVKRQMAKVGLTQQEAARLIGKSPGMVSMVLAEKAKSAPILRAIWALTGGPRVNMPTP